MATQVMTKFAEAREPASHPQLDRELNSLLKGGGTAFVGKSISTALKYITLVLVARVLGVELFGLYTLGLIIYQVGALLASMGLENGAVRFLSIFHSAGHFQKVKGLLLQAIGLPLFGGVVVGSILFLHAEVIARDVFAKPELALPLRILAAAIPFGASMSVTAYATTAFHTTRYLVYVRDLLQPSVNLALLVLIWVMGLGLYGATAAWGVSVMCGMVAAVYSVSRVFPDVGHSSVEPSFDRRLLKFSLPLVFGDLTGYVLMWTDVLMVGYLRPAADVGIYRAASQTAMLLLIFLISLNTIFAPLVAELHGKEEYDKMAWLFRTATRWSLSLTLPLYVVFTLAGREILQMFGQAFTIGWLPLIILGTGQMINAGTGGVGYILIMSGHQYSKLFGDLVLAIANIFLDVILIPQFGLVGAAIAMAISIGGVNILRGIQVYNALRIHAYDRELLKVVGAGGVAAVCGLVMRQWFPSMHFLLSLTVTAGTVLSVYVLLLWRMRLEGVDEFTVRRLWKRSELSQV